MAVEWMEGFDFGYSPQISIGGASISASGRTGYSLVGGGGASAQTITLSATPSKTFGAAYLVPSAGVYGSSQVRFVEFWSGAVLHLTVWINSTGRIEVRRGTYAGTVLAASTQVYNSFGAWRYVEAKATINDTTGTCIVMVDGVEWINFTGNTSNGAGTNIDILKCGMTNGATIGYDDMYVLDGTDSTATTGRPDNTFLGDVKVVSLLPNANTATNQWIGSDTNSIDNYLLIDEVPVNTSDYIGTATNGQQDLWGLTDLAANTLTIYAIQPMFYAAKSDAGTAGIKSLLRESGGTTLTGADRPLSTTYAYYREPIATTKPSGGAWSLSDVNGLQLGVEKT